MVFQRHYVFHGRSSSEPRLSSFLLQIKPPQLVFVLSGIVNADARGARNAGWRNRNASFNPEVIFFGKNWNVVEGFVYAEEFGQASRAVDDLTPSPSPW